MTVNLSSNDHNKAMPPVADIVDNSPDDHMHRAVGHEVSKTITLSVNNGTQSLNCFQITGSVEIMKLFAHVTDTTVMTNLTAAFFELDDGAAQVDITLDGAVLSGLAVGTYVVKNAIATSALAVANNAAGAITEPAADKKAFAPFIATQKTGQNTYIRFTYTSTDAPINAQIEVHIEARGLNGGTLVAV